MYTVPIYLYKYSEWAHDIGRVMTVLIYCNSLVRKEINYCLATTLKCD